LNDHNDGVPLEHYISCIKDIQILTGQGVIKKVQYSHTPGVPFMPTPFDTSNSKEDNLLLLILNERIFCSSAC
jgi:hypothetical protein